MTDVEKIAETLGLCRIRLQRCQFRLMSFNPIEAVKREVEYERAVRDVRICEKDLRTAIENESYARK